MPCYPVTLLSADIITPVLFVYIGAYMITCVFCCAPVHFSFGLTNVLINTKAYMFCHKVVFLLNLFSVNKHRPHYHCPPTEAAYAHEIGAFAIIITVTLLLLVVYPDAEKAYLWLVRKVQK